MESRVALLRGINVGGRNILPMQDLRDIMTALGCELVNTYIQSGNVVFLDDSDRDRLSRRVTDAVQGQFGFSPFVLVMSGTQFRAIAEACPFDVEGLDPKSLHVWFATNRIRNANVDRMNALRSAGESFHLEEQAFYLHAPDGIGRSKLASDVEACLGEPGTGRNWRTVSKLIELLDAQGV